MKKVPVVVGDSPAFVVNRVGVAFYTVAGHLAVYGAATCEKIDQVLEKRNFAHGPFAVLDVIGLKTASLVSNSIQRLTAKDKPGLVFLLEQLLNEGCTGRSFEGSSSGFHFWKDGEKVKPNPQVLSATQTVHEQIKASQTKNAEKRPISQLSDEDIFTVTMLGMLNEVNDALRLK